MDEKTDYSLPDITDSLLTSLTQCAEKLNLQIYLVGGALRDILMGQISVDLDFTIPAGSCHFLEQVRTHMGSGTIVPLGEKGDDTCRLVIDNLSVDVSGFRKGAMSIEEDLVCRDFTINSLGVRLDVFLQRNTREVLTDKIVDPLGGIKDLRDGVIRACPAAFTDDPLRLLRAYRFAAQRGFVITDTTLEEISTHAQLIETSAAERISHEMDLIMSSSRAYQVLVAMKVSGLLLHLIPELYDGLDVSQPPFHHLNVFEHNLEALNRLEQIIGEPKRYFSDRGQEIAAFFENEGNRIELKWAALLHDVGKPVTKKLNPEKQDRITFYNHDEAGAEIVELTGERMRWSRRRSRRIGSLIAMHMHPFHLGNVLKKDGELSRRAMLKLCKRAGDDLMALFLLAMADSLAGQGPEKPAGIEELLEQLFYNLDVFYEETMQPVLSGPKLLTGHDLIDTLGLIPGPELGLLLVEVETAAIEGKISTKKEALAWVKKQLTDR